MKLIAISVLVLALATSACSDPASFTTTSQSGPHSRGSGDGDDGNDGNDGGDSSEPTVRVIVNKQQGPKIGDTSTDGGSKRPDGTGSSTEKSAEGPDVAPAAPTSPIVLVTNDVLEAMPSEDDGSTALTTIQFNDAATVKGCGTLEGSSDCLVIANGEGTKPEESDEVKRRIVYIAGLHSSTYFLILGNDSDKWDKWGSECARGNPVSCASMSVLKQELPQHQFAYNKTFFAVDVERARVIVGKRDNAKIKDLRSAGLCEGFFLGNSKRRTGDAYRARHHLDNSFVFGTHCAAGDKGACDAVDDQQQLFNNYTVRHRQAAPLAICVMARDEIPAEVASACLPSSTKATKLETFRSYHFMNTYERKRKEFATWDGACTRGNQEACATKIVAERELKLFSAAWAKNEFGPEAEFTCYLDMAK